jgi:hypothetical protein
LKLGGIPFRVSRSSLAASPSRVGRPPVELDDLRDRWRLRHCLRGDSADSPLPDRSAGRWPLPPAPRDSRASPRGLQGSIPFRRAVETKSRPLARSSGLVLSFGDDETEPSVRPRSSGTTPPRGGPDAGIVTVRTPLLGLSKDHPSVDISSARPLPAPFTRERVSLPSTRGCQLPSSFRPCRSSRLRRLSPRSALQVCCTLQPTMGFATFQVRQSTRHPPRDHVRTLARVLLRRAGSPGPRSSRCCHRLFQVPRRSRGPLPTSHPRATRERVPWSAARSAASLWTSPERKLHSQPPGCGSRSVEEAGLEPVALPSS